MSMDELAKRVKRYEEASNRTLVPRTPVLIRVDGRAFHSFLRGREKPFDLEFIDAMREAARDVSEDMQGFCLGYVQSDEATFMLADYLNLDSQPWFGGDHSKVVSLSAALFTAAFNDHFGSKRAVFDARAFNVPREDVPNMFIWRQRDWQRNSLHMYARSFFSHRELHGKGRMEIHEMLHKKGTNWGWLDQPLRDGTFILPGGSFRSEKADYHLIDGWIREIEGRE